MRIAVIGLGIIGGSLCKAFREYTGHYVMGYNRTAAVAQRALELGAVHEICTPEALKTADVIYLCLYPQAAVNFVKQYHDCIRPGCIVTDAAGIKTAICSQLKALAEEYGFIFVGSHPMAGKERSGFEVSEASLFNGASYILVPCGAPRMAVDTLKKLALEIGFTMTPETTPEEHDRMIGYVSQLCHAIAVSLMCANDNTSLCEYTGDSFRDLTRIARINDKMWAELFLWNKQNLISEIDQFDSALQEMRAALVADDRDKLEQMFRLSTQRRAAFDKKLPE